MLGTGLKRSHFAEAEGDLAWGTSAAFHVTGCFVDTHGCPEAGYMETQLDTESCPDVGLARLCDMPGKTDMRERIYVYLLAGTSAAKGQKKPRLYAQAYLVLWVRRLAGAASG